MTPQKEIIEMLAAAVTTVMNPVASNEERQAADKICEDFKENAKGCVEYGLILAEKQNPPFVRHFGLQIVEHSIKYRWLEIGPDERTALKRNTLLYINQGTKDILEEEQHVKDGISRVLVELIKREWPQLWENLFPDFTLICQNGETQTELVLQTLLRLSEDVVRFQNVPQPRRRDLLQALTTSMDSIFSFFQFILKTNLDAYRNKTGIESVKACKICQSILNTLTGFVDWINIKYVSDTDNLLPVLCGLLLDKELCLTASECLLLVVGRRGKLSERKPLLMLFSEDAMKVLLQAANIATDHITESTNFIFLKRLCEILLEIGKQLCALWGSTEDTGRPQNFDMYLKAIVAFTQHPSQSLRQMIYNIWLALLRHPEASKDEIFQEILPTFIQCCTMCLHKVGYPSQSNSPSCDYSRLEFGSDEEFSAVLANLRMSVVESIRMVSLMAPKLTFMAASSWLREQIGQPITIGEGADADKGICNLSSPSLISWDACSVFLEAVMSKLFLSEAEKPDLKEGIDLFLFVLAYENHDPLILSTVLSCLSALFPFLTYAPQTLHKVLAKIFDSVMFNLPGQTKSTRLQAVKNVRVHACSVLVKICKHYPDLLLPEFQHLYNCVKQLDQDREQLSQMEKTILIEALIIVSNQFHNFAQQSAFLEEVISPVKELWTSAAFTEAFSSPECFMSYVGLDQAAVEPSSADTCGINRSHITYCINTILAIIKRSQCPEDFEVASRGGFIIPCSSGHIMQNPATAHIIPLLDNLLTLIKTCSCLYLPQFTSLRHTDFTKAYDLMEHERLNILGIPPACVDNSDSLMYRRPLERMQNFITGVFENGYHILGNASQYLGAEFYSAPNIPNLILEKLALNFKLLPDHRARIFIRNLIKPLMQSCPKEQYTSVVIPILTIICPDIYQRLIDRWQVINKRFEEGNDNEDESPESQEILEDQLVRQLTREYLELLGLVLSGKNVVKEVKEEEEMEEGGDGIVRASNINHNVHKELSELGILIIGTPELYPSIIMCVLTGFSWSDSWVCHRCAHMIWPICKQLVTNNQMSQDTHQHVFMSILSGLQLHGQHDGCQAILISLALTYYENMRQKFPVLTEILMKIPDVDKNLMKNLEEKLTSSPKAGLEKKKKDAFKKIVTNIIGKNIGQRFRRTAQYTILPRLFLESRRPKQASLVDDQNSSNLGLCELFSPTANLDD